MQETHSSGPILFPEPGDKALNLGRMTTANWRTINIDLYDPDSAANFPVTSLLPSSLGTTSAPEVQSLGGQIKQLLRGGDTEGALRGALEDVPYGGDSAAKVC